jgi:ABC-type antimicrobial peptide transport system permease subunit
MLKNYIKIAWRNLVKNKTYSFINIVGLAAGMAVAILIGIWIRFETSFDDFQVNKDRIAIIKKHTLFNNEKSTYTATPLPLHDELINNYPEIEWASRMDWGGDHSLVVGDKKLNKKGTYVDEAFLKMFSFPLIKGNIEQALRDPNSIVLTESLAKTLFGSNDAIGKIVKLDNQYSVQVSAVAKDVPKNSSITFDFLAPYSFLVQNVEFVKNAKTQWGNNFMLNVIQLKQGVSMEAFSKKLGSLLAVKDEENKNQFLFLHPMSKWHLYDDFDNWVNVGGKIEYVRLFGIIGVFVLLIACINFMNLATARSERRAREVGIRKAIGSRRKQLIVQFLFESMLTAFFAFLLALVFIQLSIPFLKNINFENISFSFTDLSLLSSVLAVCIITGLIAGSYPALYLSSFVPVKVLKGAVQQGKGTLTFRKVLVVSQFAISIGLIISTVIVYQQIQHAKSRSLGYDPDNLILVSSSSDLSKNYEVLKQDLLNTGYFKAISKSSSSMTNISNQWGDFSWEGKDPTADISIDVIMTSWDFEKAAGLRFKKGRPFSREFKTDSTAVILNEAAVKLIGFKEPVGKTIKLGDKVLTIIGVTENVVIQDPFKPVSPGAIIQLYNKENTSNILLRLQNNAGLEKAIAAMKPVFEKYNPSLPFEYKFADEEFGKKFEIENQVAKLSGIFAGLTIFISCLGLFGLAAFMAERRTKEIGIRKVLGATVGNLWMLLSREFVVLVLIACAIASPVAFTLMNHWLEKYDYRIDIGLWIFAVAATAAILIAVLTVSFQAIKAAIANPVKSLRTE